MNSEIILKTRNLGKHYRHRWAVRNLNLEVHRGDVFGFLGPNGAGKSTTIRMILSLIRPTEGDVELFGYPLSSERRKALARTSGLVEKADFYLYLSALRNLEILGTLSGGVDRSRIQETIALVGLSGREHDRVKTYSHGMKQRLGIAQALLADPELVILDEPMNGLDPQGIKEIRNLILHLAHERGKTIFLSSHLLSEIELVANRMAVINRGELAAQGDVEALLEHGEQYVNLKAGPAEKVRQILEEKGIRIRSFDEGSGEFSLDIRFDETADLTGALVRADVEVHAVVPRRSLEDYFLSITESGVE
ncbi:MAG: ABC transporter ATP-binding protein [Bacteroidota bacterium]